jgi:hypothetical protein
VVVGHGLPLFGGQSAQRRPEVGVAGGRIAVRRRTFGHRLGRRWLAGPGATRVQRAAVRDRHEPRLDVGALGQVRIGAQRRQEGFRPGILGVDRADDRAAHPQHGRTVLGHHLFERTHLHIM